LISSSIWWFMGLHSGVTGNLHKNETAVRQYPDSAIKAAQARDMTLL